jgi:hypothetical protein
MIFDIFTPVVSILIVRLCRLLVRCGWISCGSLALTTPLAADRLVATFATADQAYVEKRYADGKPEPETYFVVEGRSYAGNVRDRTLRRTTAVDIARVLAPALAARAYYPASALVEADLMIILHWGATKARQHYLELVDSDRNRAGDDQRALQEFSSGYTAGLEKTLQDELEAQAHEPQYYFDFSDGFSDRVRQDLVGRTTAEMLGLQQAVNRNAESLFGTEEGRTVRAMLAESRYFIILIAYDYREYQRSGSLRRLWTARLSVRADGVNFSMAAGRFANAGANLFGLDQPTLKFHQTRRGEAQVEVGEATVISVEAP